MRDWFPLSALGPFRDLVDQLMGERADWGSMKCGCHPNCGIGTVLFVNKKTQQMVPLTQFLDMEGLLEDIARRAEERNTGTGSRPVPSPSNVPRRSANRRWPPDRESR